MKFFLSLILVGLGCSLPAQAACSGSGLSWNCTAGSTVSDVQNAVNNASDGAQINFAAGTYSWGNGIRLTNTKGVTLQGAGAGSSVVNVTGAPVISMDTLSGNNTKLYRITGFTFQNAPANLIIWFYGSGTMNNLRIDHNTFHNFATSSIAIFLGETGSVGKFYGVIDHNTFSGNSNFMGLKYLGPGVAQWPAALRGTSQNLFMEDNTFNFTTANDLGSGCVDVWKAGAVVFRYNKVTNCLVTAHGVSHGSTVNFELYGNLLRRTAGSGGMWENGTRLFHHQGSGEIFAFKNTFEHTGTIGGALAITHYRSASPSVAGYDSSLGRCDGSSAVDGNRSGQLGYPCWMQPGRAPAGGSPGYGTLSPVYAFMNVDAATGSRVPVVIENPWGVTNPSVDDHIKANRDYYDAVSNQAQTSSSTPFNGTSGMGFGVLNFRPTTCTTNTSEAGGGVGYFATDQGPQGTLYRCSAANTWVVHYTPYSYPHPLVGGVAPTPAPALEAPTNLRAISVSYNEAKLQFDYSGSSQTGFSIHRKSGAAGTYAQTGTTANLSFSDGTVAAATQYCYQVKAYNASVISAASNELCLTTAASPVIQPPPAGGETLLGSTTPATLNNNDGVNYELGMKFTAATEGTISAIRFYKSSSETGTHTGKIYSSSGALLASVVFSSETASGWQQQSLSSPLAISANSVYVVTVNTGACYYAATVSDMSSLKFSTNLRSVVGGNGVFGPVGSMPTSSWSDSNYFRDVVFTAGTASPAPAPTIASMTASPAAITSGQSSTLSWSVSDATSLILNPGNINVTGTSSRSVAPTATTTYTLTATNSSGSVSKSVTVTVAAPQPPPSSDSQAPVVSITSPANGSTVLARSTVSITANASDDIGVAKVEIYVNGALLCTDNTAPYVCNLSIHRKSGRTYQIQGTAYDTSGKVSTSQIVAVTSK